MISLVFAALLELGAVLLADHLLKDGRFARNPLGVMASRFGHPLDGAADAGPEAIRGSALRGATAVRRPIGS